MDKLLIENTALFQDAVTDLTASPKRMNPKWFYDHIGSVLFEQITQLPEYYPTRTEVSIFRTQGDKLASYVQDDDILVELGSGASIKTRILLDEFENLGGYVPIDISASFLKETAAKLSDDYPNLPVYPVVGDFLGELTLPEKLEASRKVGFFPGSTIGNLDTAEAIELLKKVRRWDNISAFILGVDLVKDIDVLINAYDDAAGVTAQFNLNLLSRLNRECGASFDLSKFEHQARWNEELSRIEMHLVSLEDQTVQLGAVEITFEAGESIHTESSHKYTKQSIEDLANRSGWKVNELVADDDDLFAVAMLQPV